MESSVFSTRLGLEYLKIEQSDWLLWRGEGRTMNPQRMVSPIPSPPLVPVCNYYTDYTYLYMHPTAHASSQCGPALSVDSKK